MLSYLKVLDVLSAQEFVVIEDEERHCDESSVVADNQTAVQSALICFLGDSKISAIVSLGTFS